MKNINIGDAELEVMKVIWSETEPVSSAEINNRVESHGWQTYGERGNKCRKTW